mmetsp:Transcript_46445/g.92189  ORF Transcript_46445/g.92189 Transcript_46445/m.92189 type:complete len:221 (-) Transcript_46445:519-1181(-)
MPRSSRKSVSCASAALMRSTQRSLGKSLAIAVSGLSLDKAVGSTEARPRSTNNPFELSWRYSSPSHCAPSDGHGNHVTWTRFDLLLLTCARYQLPSPGQQAHTSVPTGNFFKRGAFWEGSSSLVFANIFSLTAASARSAASPSKAIPCNAASWLSINVATTTRTTQRTSSSASTPCTAKFPERHLSAASAALTRRPNNSCSKAGDAVEACKSSLARALPD